MNDVTHIAKAAEQVFDVWAGAPAASSSFEPLQLRRHDAQPAQRFADFAALLAHLRGFDIEQGWIMQPSAVSCLTEPGQTLPDDAPWLAAELALRGTASLAVHHDGQDFVCAHVEELADDSDTGDAVLVRETLHSLTDSPAAPRGFTHLRYRVIHQHDQSQGWQPVACRFAGFQQLRRD